MLSFIILCYHLHGDNMKDKLLNFIKRNKWVLYTGILSTLVVIILYILQKIAPFGNNSMLDVDFYHQYGPLLNELYDRVKSGESLLYSFNTGGGIPFYRNFLNYLSSPFNLILFLFKKENIVMAFSIVIGLKAIFASLTMSYYLKKTFKKDNFLIALFGILYAFSGYFCAYYWNIMWLDGMVFLPLIMLGINKIVKEGKPNLYIISLAVMLFSNYFIGYMICIFSVFYFIGVFIYFKNFKFKNIVKKCVMFALASLLSAGLVSFVLLPLFYSLSSISATGDLFPDASTSFSISQFIFNHFTGVSRTVFASDILPLPNVYCGMITICLVLLLFFNNKINLRFKIISILALLFFFFSFNVTTIDFIWHAFHIPNDLPWRYSFIYIFVLITIAYYSFSKIKDVSILRLSICFGVVFILTLLSSKLGFENINDQKVIICLILLLIYYVISILYKYNYNKKLLGIIFSVVALSECIYGININWNIDHDITNFMSDKKPIKELISDIKKDDNDLYRIEKTSYLTLNDGAWYDYYGISTFTSMAYEDVSKAQRMLGLSGNNINSYYYKEYQTPVYNTIFNIKYLIGNYIENDYYVPINSSETYNAIGYNYSSSIAYAVNDEIDELFLESYKPFLNQSNFVTLSTGVNDIFTPVKLENISGGTINNLNNGNYINGEYSYILNEGSSELSVTLDNSKLDNIYLYIGGTNVSSFSVNNNYYSLTSDEYYVFDSGLPNDSKININITFENSDPGNLYFYAYYLNEDSFEKFYNKIKDNSLKVTKYSDTIIEGNINVDEDKTLFTSIAYDEDWKIFIDGKQVETKKIMDSYLGCNIEKGNHEIKLVYYPNKMKIGLLISMFSLIIFIIYNLIDYKLFNKKIKKDEFIV